MSAPRIYAACLSSHNSGVLHGAWIDAAQDVDIVREEIADMLDSSPAADAEEYAIHDRQDFYSYSVSEFADLQELCEVARFIEDHRELGAELLAGHCDDVAEAARMMSENYRGEYRNLSHFAEEFVEDCVEIPDYLSGYVDYEKMGRDMELCGDIFTIQLGFEQFHVFWGH